MVQCNLKCADPGKIIPTPEQCQPSDHGCLINAASSYWCLQPRLLSQAHDSVERTQLVAQPPWPEP